jgi:hypothetical protein
LELVTSREPSINESIERINERLEAGNCILFAGSGLSAPAGFPTWKDFAKGLVDRFGSAEDKALALEALALGETDSVVYNISRAHESELVPYIREVFGARVPPSEAHHRIAALNFQSAITSNWDHLLEQTYPNASVMFPDSTEELQSQHLKRQFFVLKMYGDPDSPGSLILSGSDFERTVANNSAFISFMYSLFLQQTILFVGCSLEGIDNLLRSFRYFQPSGQHFALSGVTGTAWRSRARLLRDKYNVVTVPYDGPLEMLDLLRRLESKSPELTQFHDNEKVQTLRGHSAAVTSIAVSPDGRFLASGSYDNTVKIWDFASGELLRNLTGHRRWVAAVAITPDNKSVLSGSDDRSVKVWDAQTGVSVRELRGHWDTVLSVAVTQDGSFAISGSADQAIRVWDLANRPPFGPLTGHSDEVWSVAVNSARSFIVSSSSDKTVLVWNLSDGAMLHRLEGHADKVVSVTITPDGRSAVSASYDRSLKVCLVRGICG